MATINVTDATFEEEVLKSDKPVLVKATAKWCGPCKAMAPTLEEVAEEMKDQIKIYDLDIDENPITPTKYESELAAKPNFKIIFKSIFWILKNISYLRKKHIQVNNNRKFSTESLIKMNIMLKQ